jgi:antitoxin component of RelBE/YafQ-DinJ toxin-antitoxin module
VAEKESIDIEIDRDLLDEAEELGLNLDEVVDLALAQAVEDARKGTVTDE